VHRHQHDRLATVYAFRAELDEWTRSRRPEPADDPTNDASDDVAAPAVVEPGLPVPQPSARSVSAPKVVGALRRPALAIALVVGVVAAPLWWHSTTGPSVWRDPFAGATFRRVTDFDGVEQAAAISRDGRFFAFLSNRDGRTDVWVSQIGTNRFFNLTRSRFADLVNPSVRTLGFSPDGALVTFWARGAGGTARDDISIWAVPTLGGDPRVYLEGAAEIDWSPDGSRAAYHTTAPGDPTFVTSSIQQRPAHALFQAPAPLHAHFPTWSPDGSALYFVQGAPPDAMDLWRVGAAGGVAERLTRHQSRVSHPVLLDQRTLAYLAADADGSGPWLHAIDPDDPVPHKVTHGLDRYTSLAASADGRRLVAALADPKVTLWRVSSGTSTPALSPISLPTGRGTTPRLGPGYVLYVSPQETGDSVWRLAPDGAIELWTEPGARVVGGPEIAADGRRIVMTVRLGGRTLLYTMNADGTGKRVVAQSLALVGSPSWGPDGTSIVSAVVVNGTPRVSRIAPDGTTTPLVKGYSVDPAWSPRGDRFVYTAADVGTTVHVLGAAADGEPWAIPQIALTRGARRVRLLDDGRTLVALLGPMGRKGLWSVDLVSGARRQLAALPPDFDASGFDVSSDGQQFVVERVQDYADIVLIERPLGK
jgi:Tol biopolymer transport system component